MALIRSIIEEKDSRTYLPTVNVIESNETGNYSNVVYPPMAYAIKRDPSKDYDVTNVVLSASQLPHAYKFSDRGEKFLRAKPEDAAHITEGLNRRAFKWGWVFDGVTTEGAGADANEAGIDALKYAESHFFVTPSTGEEAHELLLNAAIGVESNIRKLNKDGAITVGAGALMWYDEQGIGHASIAYNGDVRAYLYNKELHSFVHVTLDNNQLMRQFVLNRMGGDYGKALFVQAQLSSQSSRGREEKILAQYGIEILTSTEREREVKFYDKYSKLRAGIIAENAFGYGIKDGGITYVQLLVNPGDLILLATDGVHDAVSNEDIYQSLIDDNISLSQRSIDIVNKSNKQDEATALIMQMPNNPTIANGFAKNLSRTQPMQQRTSHARTELIKASTPSQPPAPPRKRRVF